MMSPTQKEGPRAVSRVVWRRYPNQLMELRDSLPPHPGPPHPAVPPASTSGRAVSMPNTRISVVASAVRLPERPDLTEWRVSIVAHTLAHGADTRRVRIRPAEAEGWARAVFGDPLGPYLYLHVGASGLNGPTTGGVHLDTPHYVVYLGGEGPVPAPPDLAHYRSLVPVSH